jgi:hypothetical protein
MRRASITSVLLILALGTSASACVAGWGSQSAPSCVRPNARQARARTKPSISTAVGTTCGHSLKSLPGNCGLRNFVQFQFVTFHKFEVHTPLRPTCGNISAPLDSAIIVSSIGSPETDRGPPRS